MSDIQMRQKLTDQFDVKTLDVHTSSPSATAAAVAGPGAPLTPGMILDYVAMRLGGIDDQMDDFRKEADKRKQRQDDLRNFEAAVRELMGSNGYDTSGVKGKANDTLKYPNRHAEANAEAIAKLDNARSKLAGSPDLQAKIDGLKADILDDSIITPEKLNNTLENAKDEIAGLNADNEMTMMRLSSLMQMRTQVVQFSSNVMASLNDASKSVIQNMRA
jgi:hypothetical protein